MWILIILFNDDDDYNWSEVKQLLTQIIFYCLTFEALSKYAFPVAFYIIKFHLTPPL